MCSKKIFYRTEEPVIEETVAEAEEVQDKEKKIELEIYCLVVAVKRR